MLKPLWRVRIGDRSVIESIDHEGVGSRTSTQGHLHDGGVTASVSSSPAAAAAATSTGTVTQVLRESSQRVTPGRFLRTVCGCAMRTSMQPPSGGQAARARGQPRPPGK